MIEKRLEISENDLVLHEGKSKRSIDEDSLMLYLGENVIIRDGTTFGRIFDLIIKNRKMFNSLFYVSLGGIKIDDLLEDYASLTNGEYSKYFLGISTELIYVLIGRGKSTFTIKHSIACYEKDEKYSSDSIGISPEYMSLSDLRGMEIKLLSSVFMYKEFDRVDVCPAKSLVTYRLFDMLDCILKMITCNGKPTARNEKYESLLSAVRQFNSKDDHIDNDELHLQILKKELDHAISTEDYEKAARIKINIQSIQKRLSSTCVDKLDMQ